MMRGVDLVLIKTQNMEAIIDASYVYYHNNAVYGKTCGDNAIVLGKYDNRDVAIQVIFELEKWLNEGNEGVFWMHP